MKSILGYCFAIVATVLFALAYYEAIRSGATWLDARWLFAVALPYNELALSIAGESNFAPNSAPQLVYAWLVDVVCVYLIGAAIEAVGRFFYKVLRRLRWQA